MEKTKKKQRRGFAAMDPNKQREIASKGGKASHDQGTGHEWNTEEARAAGAKGGFASQRSRHEAAKKAQPPLNFPPPPKPE